MKNIYRYTEIDELIEEINSWRDTHFIGITGLHGQPIHGGHVDLLREANKKCGVLIAALNGDESSIRKSGHCFMSFGDRAAVLGSISYVDYVVENPFDTMVELLHSLPVNIYFKGGDVTEENLLEREKDACVTNGIKIWYNTGGGKTASSRNFLEDYFQYRLHKEMEDGELIYRGAY